VPFDSTISMVASFLVGGGLSIYGLYQRSRLANSQDWPQVTGKITKSAVGIEISTSDTGPSRSYVAEVEYEYPAKGAAFTGKRIGFTRHSYVRQRKAQEEAARYPVNSPVTVHFNPDSPADAVLVREAPGSVLCILGGVAILAIGVFAVLY
jgi:hypothetical protein